jgi:hypothetical protein
MDNIKRCRKDAICMLDSYGETTDTLTIFNLHCFSMATTARRMRLSVSYSTLPMFFKHLFTEFKFVHIFVAEVFRDGCRTQTRRILCYNYCLKSSRKVFFLHFSNVKICETFKK